MDSKAFMMATGIKYQSALSMHIKKGRVKPRMIGREYVFTGEDVKRMLAYLNPEAAIKFEKTELEKMQEQIDGLKEEVKALKGVMEYLRDREGYYPLPDTPIKVTLNEVAGEPVK